MKATPTSVQSLPPMKDEEKDGDNNSLTDSTDILQRTFSLRETKVGLSRA